MTSSARLRPSTIHSAWVLLASSALAGGCPSTSNTDAGAITSIDANVGAPSDAGTDAASVGSAAIDAALGGSVTSADGVLTIEIPAGALAADTVVTIDALEMSAWDARITASAPLSRVYAVGPEGTTFSAPAVFHWRFASAPTGVIEVPGEVPFLFAMARATDGAVELHASTTTGPEGVALVVDSEVMHLSEHWLTRADPDAPDLGRTGADLGAMRQAVLIPWSASDVWIRAVAPIAGHMSANAFVDSGPIRLVGNDAWVFYPGDPEEGVRPTSILSEPMFSLAAGSTWRPMEMPSWECMGPGRGRVSVRVAVTSGTDRFVTGTRFVQDIECIEREDKPEYTAEVAAIGEGNIEPLSTPGGASYALEDGGGEHAYLVHVPPGRRVRICVSTTGSAGVMYYPRHSPGFEYTDPAPGCSELLNLDPDLPNSALVVITGTGVATVTVTLVE